jgi:hypothetical protein
MRPVKITFGEMRSGGGPTGILVYCADYRCSHSIEMSAEQWPDDVRLFHAALIRLRPDDKSSASIGHRSAPIQRSFEDGSCGP